jgi:hypothetical protein
MYALERESNYTPLYKKYFYKKGTTLVPWFRSPSKGLRFVDSRPMRALHQ